MSDALDDRENGPAVAPPQGPAPFQIPFEHCRAKAMGWISGFSECLAEAERSCPHRVAFGYGFFCHHPDHKLIAAATLSR